MTLKAVKSEYANTHMQMYLSRAVEMLHFILNTLNRCVCVCVCVCGVCVCVCHRILIVRLCRKYVILYVLNYFVKKRYRQKMYYSKTAFKSTVEVQCFTA